MTKITWMIKGTSVLDMDPLQYLQATARWSEEGPEDEPWIAVGIPTTRAKENISLSLSLDGYHAFSPETIASLKTVIESMLRDYTPDEVRAIKAEEQEKGNPEWLFSITSSFMRVIVPRRLLKRVQHGIESALAGVVGPVVIEDDVD